MDYGTFVSSINDLFSVERGHRVLLCFFKHLQISLDVVQRDPILCQSSTREPCGPTTHDPFGFPCSRHALGGRSLDHGLAHTFLICWSLETAYLVLPQSALDAPSPYILRLDGPCLRPVASLPVSLPTPRPCPPFFTSFFLSTRVPLTGPCCLPKRIPGSSMVDIQQVATPPPPPKSLLLFYPYFFGTLWEHPVLRSPSTTRLMSSMVRSAKCPPKLCTISVIAVSVPLHQPEELG